MLDVCVCMTVCVVCSKLKTITSHCLTADASQLILGTDGGSIHVFDVDTFALTDKVVNQDSLLQK